MLRRKYGERLGIRVVERPGNSVFTGASVSWNGKGNVGFEKHLSLLLMEIGSFLFVFLLPLVVILLVALTILDQLSPSKP